MPILISTHLDQLLASSRGCQLAVDKLADSNLSKSSSGRLVQTILTILTLSLYSLHLNFTQRDWQKASAMRALAAHVLTLHNTCSSKVHPMHEPGGS